jgi:tripartite-type tricarboxylate transporter receptor subunit TctC
MAGNTATGSHDFMPGVDPIDHFMTGGGFDTIRGIGAYRNIPGQPNIVVQYMPGATGIVAANHLYNIAADTAAVIGALSIQSARTAVWHKKRNTSR